MNYKGIEQGSIVGLSLFLLPAQGCSCCLSCFQRTLYHHSLQNPQLYKSLLVQELFRLLFGFCACRKSVNHWAIWFLFPAQESSCCHSSFRSSITLRTPTNSILLLSSSTVWTLAASVSFIAFCNLFLCMQKYFNPRYLHSSCCYGHIYNNLYVNTTEIMSWRMQYSTSYLSKLVSNFNLLLPLSSYYFSHKINMFGFSLSLVA